MEHHRQFGRWLEEFTVGDVYHPGVGRTITEHDETWFSLMTMNHNPGHIDAAASEAMHFGKRVVNGTFVLAIGVGLTAADLTGKAKANIGFDKVVHTGPTFPGDTLYARTTILDVQRSATKPDRGVVVSATEVYNQNDVVVLRYERTVLVGSQPVLDSEPDLEQAQR